MWSLIRVCKLIVWNGRENSKKELIHNEHLKTTVPMTNTLIKFLFFSHFFHLFFLLFFLYVYLIFFLISHDLYSAHDFNFHWTHWHEPLLCWCVCSMYRSSLCARLFFSSEIIKKWMNFFRLTTNNSFFLLLYTQLI